MLKKIFKGHWGIRFLINMYPPLWFTGIWVDEISEDFYKAKVSMPLRWYNRNYVGTHFGGSLYSLTDALYMIMLMHILGKDYYCWDKAGRIDYIAPGRGKVTGYFVITPEQIDDIKQKTANGEKYLPEFVVEIVDEKGESVARVVRTIYVRKKKSK